MKAAVCRAVHLQVLVRKVSNVVMGSPGTHLVKNHESQFKNTRSHACMGLYVTRQLI